MTVQLSPRPKLQFYDDNGEPLVGGKLYTYAAGTSTPLATYTDSTGNTENANPVILDSRGEAGVWLSTSSYKFVLKTSADVTIWTVDNIGAAVAPTQPLETLVIALGNQSDAIAAATGLFKWHMPCNFTVTEVIIGLHTAQVSGSILTFDVNKNGTTILSTKITVDNGEATSITAATPPVISVSALSKGDAMTADCDQIGNGTAIGPILYLTGYRS